MNHRAHGTDLSHLLRNYQIITSTPQTNVKTCILTRSWASWPIRKIANCACAGNAGNVSPCVTWCMPGSLTSGYLGSRWRGKRSRHSLHKRNPQFTYLLRGPCIDPGPLAVATGQRFGHRFCVMLGSVLMATGVFVTAFLRNVMPVIVCLGGIAGNYRRYRHISWRCHQPFWPI